MIRLPCGRCNGCKQDKAEDWALRCMHEAQMHSASCFLTLTYADEHLPEDYSVSVRPLQLFNKKLRKFAHPSRLRFFACGEYGDLGDRPHYHSIIFGYDFPDKIPFSQSESGEILYTSEKLTNLWGLGHCTIGAVTYASAKYVANYCIKKAYGDQAAARYNRTHPVNGRVHLVKPEFVVMSRRPGLGDSWFAKYKSDCFPSDFLVVEGRQHRVPTYYLNKLHEEEQTTLKRQRKLKSNRHREDNTRERLAVRHQVALHKMVQRKRVL